MSPHDTPTDAPSRCGCAVDDEGRVVFCQRHGDALLGPVEIPKAPAIPSECRGTARPGKAAR